MTTNGIAHRYTRSELDRFESMLLERRQFLMGDVRAMEEGEAQDASDTFNASTHQADLGSDRASSDVSLGRRESESAEVQEIDDALERIAAGAFGLCETCDKGITKARLEAIPYARLCLSCKVLEEQ